ncbi:RagB/SusD family nutrient uptake outer membrane protein [Dyadobacter tibetensis]|uniref:RagB/SusD family nutrient uptake outer membrane protein n=1 Tax=Dyadobacter tibetensis TaxID=1211851 RepID=UPI000471E34D|nr:RagB/SusD family nutrient uptake outer membrane protein [Dyadobacter tibetensis]
MKKPIISILAMVLSLVACDTLDLNPLSDGSSETWNSNAEELEMSLNGLYKEAFWMMDQDDWTDDWLYREATTDITGATINGQTGFVRTWWSNTYKAIARANIIIQGVDRAKEQLSAQELNRYLAEARFVRASQYARLISHFGNVVYLEKPVDIEEALNTPQTDKASILQKIYEDYDFAAQNLKGTYGSGELKRASAGAAYAMKARIALQMGDWAVAKDAAKACMDLNVYQLHSDFGNLFLSRTKNSKETIFGLPRSIVLNVTQGDCQNYVTRNAGGWGAKNPSWDLFASFLCVDGKPIDESPLFDPHEPFANRDPRCNATIVPFQSGHLGFIYQPHPDSLQVKRLSDNTYVQNKDNRVVAQYASYNGLVWKKGVDADWLQNSWRVEPDLIIIRYADVLLMYAEAKIELDQIDASVLQAMNAVRARAYQVAPTETSKYPALTLADAPSLRKLVRMERRMEFANEGIRYMDLIRWKLAEKTLNKPNYGLLDPAELKSKIVAKGLWFFPRTPSIDADGIADFSSMYDKGLIKQLTIRKFDKDRQYLWPIPTNEILTSGLVQNPNY